MNEEQLQTITVDGQQYDLTMFSVSVQQIVRIILGWEDELRVQRLDVAKTEAALRQANAELTELVKKEIGASQTVG